MNVAADNKARTRIFVTTSHISTVFITIYASATKKEGDHDVLFIDAGLRREFLIQLIDQVATHHDWKLVSNFSSLADTSHDFKPSLRKKLTRRWKKLPIVRNIYDFLLKKLLRKKNDEYKQQIKLVLGDLQNSVAELHLMTQTHLQDTLMKLFPQASIGFHEHGLGDYYYIRDHQELRGTFHCLFSEAMKRYFNPKPGTLLFDTIPHIEKFSELASELLNTHGRSLSGLLPETIEKPVVFILMEAVEMYNVRESFWTDYLDHIFSKLADPASFHFILKTHPVQTRHAIEVSTSHFSKKGFQYSLLSGDVLSSFSAEVLFQKWADQTRHVFCLFSSGCFYLSQLYREKKITFWYSTEFMNKYMKNAPPQYVNHYRGLLPLIENVFSENCTSY